MKVYEYKGKHYCEEDLSLEDELYEGDIYDLYLEMKDDHLVRENTTYSAAENPEEEYESVEEMMEDVFEELVIKDIE